MEVNTAERLELIRQVVNSSPYYRHINMEIKEVAAGSSRVEIEFKPELGNIYGTAHGGVLASLVDSACGLAIASALEPGDVAVTADLSLKFFAPFRGGKLIGVGRLISRRRHLAVAEAELRDEQGELLAKGSTTHFIQPGNAF